MEPDKPALADLLNQEFSRLTHYTHNPPQEQEDTMELEPEAELQKLIQTNRKSAHLRRLRRQARIGMIGCLTFVSLTTILMLVAVWLPDTGTEPTINTIIALDNKLLATAALFGIIALGFFTAWVFGLSDADKLEEEGVI